MGLGIKEAGEYFSGSIDELKKVSSPTRQETMQATLVTLVIIGFISICLFLTDIVMSRLVQWLLPGNN